MLRDELYVSTPDELANLTIYMCLYEANIYSITMLQLILDCSNTYCHQQRSWSTNAISAEQIFVLSSSAYYCSSPEPNLRLDMYQSSRLHFDPTHNPYSILRLDLRQLIQTFRSMIHHNTESVIIDAYDDYPLDNCPSDSD